MNRPGAPARSALPYGLGARPYDRGARFGTEIRFGTEFKVWSPTQQELQVVIYEPGASNLTTDLKNGVARDMVRDPFGYFTVDLPGITHGYRYKYRVKNRKGRFEVYPDPASRYQPEGVEGLSEIVDPAMFEWTDDRWPGRKLEDLVLYEVHVGTATPEGTFDALITYLGLIRELGVTAILLMPVAEFPGGRNWGYDGVDLFAPSHIYGGPDGLRRLVDAAHGHGLAVLLDVVYNHSGPQGNYLPQFGPYRGEHKTESGEGFNIVGTGGRQVRNFFVENACHWALEYHLDGLLLDAIHDVPDGAERELVKEIVEGVHKCIPPEMRPFVVIAEDERNDRYLLDKVGVDGLYADDFHHHVHILLTGQRNGYYAEYTPQLTALESAVNLSWYVSDTGRSEFRNRLVGEGGTGGLDRHRFVWCLENHNQVGNRPGGERLAHMASPNAYRAVSALLLLSPHVPLLLMGQEWAASTPFLFFTDHNPKLGANVTRSHLDRLKTRYGFEFDEAAVKTPQSPAAFMESKLKWYERLDADHSRMRTLYMDLLELRKNRGVTYLPLRKCFECRKLDAQTLGIFWADEEGRPLLVGILRLGPLIQNQADKPYQGDIRTEYPAVHLADGRWQTLINTEDPQYGGKGDNDVSAAGMVRMNTPGFLLFGPRQPRVPRARLGKAIEYDVFISYADEDGHQAQMIRDSLDALQKTVFLARWSMKAGALWREVLANAIERSVTVVVLVSKNISTSEWVPFECGAAEAQDKRIIPVLSGDGQALPAYLNPRHAVPLERFLADPDLD